MQGLGFGVDQVVDKPPHLVEGLGFRVKGLGFRVKGLGFRV